MHLKTLSHIHAHHHTIKSPLNTLGRAVEQFASNKSQQSRSKYNSQANANTKLSYEYLISDVKASFTCGAAVHKVTPIAPPTGCGIRPVPNRNLFEFGRGLYGNTYISVLSTLSLTPTVRLPTARLLSHYYRFSSTMVATSTRFEW